MIDEQSPASGHDYASNRWAIRAGYVTVVDMEEEREPMVVMNDMTRLRELWPVEVFDHMKWYQQDFTEIGQKGKLADMTDAV